MNNLRRKAEQILKYKDKSDNGFQKTDLESLIQELSVYQIELEHQNEELRESQQQLEFSRKKYQELFNNAPIGYIVLDTDGKIIKLNKTVLRLLKANPDDLQKSYLNKLVYSEHQDSYYQFFRQAKENKHISVDLKFKRGNNYVFARLISNSTDENEIRVAVINIQTEKNLELKLIAESKKAKESEMLKSAFLANMSHEIRTPMNGILGFSELLKDPHLNDDQQQRYISIIEESGQHMLSLINDLICISKIESGQIVTNNSEFSPAKKLDYLAQFFLPEAKSKGLLLQLDSNIPADLLLHSDKEKFLEIFSNLVKNAIKYSERGIITIVARDYQHFLEIAINDTGIGISKDHLTLIFNRFFQSVDMVKNPSEGVGLGLAITKAYVEMMGGTISAKSTVGEGSSFTVRLPK